MSSVVNCSDDDGKKIMYSMTLLTTVMFHVSPNHWKIFYNNMY